MIRAKYFTMGVIVGILIMFGIYFYLWLMNNKIVEIYGLKDDCNRLLKQTCDTANGVIDISNRQSGLLEKCYNYTEFNLTRLTKLNCEVLP